MTFSDFSKRVVIALAVSFVSLPAVAFDGATSFDSGGNGPDTPDFDGPGDLAANPDGGGGGGGGGSSSSSGGGYIANSAPNECPNGELVVEFNVDSDGHPIPTSFSRSCVIRR
ncbi:hypothetical protein [Gymnodinialimonas ulvae]|uniref:hypothetical protein n=1 Tax=Gymnodinialimonas ulvae TaxID=3126504 RepID=UPI0030A49D75